MWLYTFSPNAARDFLRGDGIALRSVASWEDLPMPRSFWRAAAEGGDEVIEARVLVADLLNIYQQCVSVYNQVRDEAEIRYASIAVAFRMDQFPHLTSPRELLYKKLILSDVSLHEPDSISIGGSHIQRLVVDEEVLRLRDYFLESLVWSNTTVMEDEDIPLDTKIMAIYAISGGWVPTGIEAVSLDMKPNIVFKKRETPLRVYAGNIL
jgi:hypothetical protein